MSAGTTVATIRPVPLPTLRVRVSRRRSVLAGVLAVSIGITGAIVYVALAVASAPGSDAVRTVGAMPRATTLTDAKGRHAFTIFQEQRLHVPLSRISPHLVRAFLAVEDRRFFSHGGFDLIRIVGAGVNNVLSWRIEQGGSTITQQLARLAFLTPERTVRRKLQEAVVARRLEQAFSKEQILELYLNKAYFGDGLYGVEAAALGYFGRHAADLDVAEAALIAGLVKSPSAYAPTVGPDRALARRNLVLQAMRDWRAIDEPTYEVARRRPLTLTDALRREERYGQYFKEEVRQKLVERFGWERVYREGLRVETTLDLDLQKAAEAEVARALADVERRQGSRARGAAQLQAALVAIDPRTGEVRALVGGRSFKDSRFNRVTQARRQPGSAFKPFVYAAALERGFTASSVLRGLDDPVMTPSGAWVPADGHVEADALTMRGALRVSSNRAAVRMLQEVGVGAVVEDAGRFGMAGMPPVPSLALGSGEVTMLSLVSAYGALANRGERVAPSFIRRVSTNSGEVLYEAAPEARAVVRPATAYLVTSMLEGVLDGGTAAQARRLGFSRPAAGKTGTTNDYRDAWFIGYTPDLVAGVWLGHDQPQTIVRNGYAAQLAVPLWTRFMLTATRDTAPQAFDAPSSVTAAAICPLSGRLATPACAGDSAAPVYTEYFEQGSEPIDYCPYHGVRRVPPITVASTTVARAAIAPAVEDPATASPAAEAPPDVQAAPAADVPAPQKKRSFWARVFRR